jgi:membrane-associated phospholipid phosphatase
MNVPAKMLSLLAAFSLVQPTISGAQTANPGYFMPPDSAAGVSSSHAIPGKTAVIKNDLLDPALPAIPSAQNPGSQWYETDWGVAGIGIAVTGLSVLADRAVNRFDEKRLSSRVKAASLHATDALELAPLAFAFATMLQSPISDPALAHASSIAVSSAAAVTILTAGIKYAVGRDRPGAADSDPFVFHPFDASRSSFGLNSTFSNDASLTSSFPSGHTALAFAVITPYAELYHQPWLYAIPVAVGLGQIAAQNGHWVSDAVAGGFIGWLTADLTRRFFPQSDYGLMIFGDGHTEEIAFSGRF